MDWDTYFFTEAYVAARKSKDPSTQVGAVIIGPPPGLEIRAKGFNGLCRGDDDSDPARYQYPLKRDVCEHAERNAIYNAARHGAATFGCSLYTNYHPCTDCARAIIQAGIVQVRYDARFPGSANYAESMALAADLFRRCGVTVTPWYGVPECLPVRCGGTLYQFAAA